MNIQNFLFFIFFFFNRKFFAAVYKIQKKDTDEFFAAKISNRVIDFEKSDDMSNSLIEEITILSAVCHPAILKFIGFNKQNFEKEKKPPEVIKNEDNPEFSEACDVYAFSLVAYEMFAGQPPFKSEEFYEAIKSNKRPEFDSSFPEDYKEIIEKCWKENPQERLKFEEIVQFLGNDDLLEKLEDVFELDIKLFD